LGALGWSLGASGELLGSSWGCLGSSWGLLGARGRSLGPKTKTRKHCMRKKQRNALRTKAQTHFWKNGDCRTPLTDRFWDELGKAISYRSALEGFRREKLREGLLGGPWGRRRKNTKNGVRKKSEIHYAQRLKRISGKSDDCGTPLADRFREGLRGGDFLP
jgi:hypothetical protein